MTRDHGGNLDAAQARFGPGDWIDLSTGINRVPYPLPALPEAVWRDLPTRARLAALERSAARAFGTTAAVVPLAGAQAAIQLLPRLGVPGLARVLAPTYNEHAAALRAAGWRVEEGDSLAALEGADLAVVVNPNNPDGRCFEPAALLALAGRVGRLIVDESFVEGTPALSLCPQAGQAGLLILRSFGKFYGLAGVRLGFVIGAAADLAPLRELAGPWPVSGAAIEIGGAALADVPWQASTRARLRTDALRMDQLAAEAGWVLVGGTDLFRLYDTPDAAQAQAQLARAKIWSRLFPYSTRWLRLGLPGSEAEWSRLEAALKAQP